MLIGLFSELPATLLWALIAVGLPAALGWSTLKVLMRNQRLSEVTLIGHGFFLGHLTLTILLRALGAPNSQVNFALVASIMALALITLVTIIYRYEFRKVDLHARSKVSLPYFSPALLTIAALLTLIIVKQAILIEEVVTRPLWGWDATDFWVKRAQDWYLLESRQYFEYDLTTESWHLGPWKEAFGTYPHPFTPSLINLWGMMAIDSHEYPATNIAWAFIPLALAAMASGFLLDRGSSLLSATITAYLVFSMPYIFTHAALPGYGELWLTGFLTSAVLLASHGLRRRSWTYASAVIFICIGLATSKRLGIGLAALVLSFTFVIITCRFIREKIILGGAGAPLSVQVAIPLFIAAITVLALSVNFYSSSGVQAAVHSIYSTLDAAAYNNIATPLKMTFFHHANWHLVGLLVVAALAIVLLLPLSKNIPHLNASLFTFHGVFAMFLLALIVGIYSFSNKYFAQAADMTTFNRSLIICMPLLITWVAEVFNNLLKSATR